MGVARLDREDVPIPSIRSKHTHHDHAARVAFESFVCPKGKLDSVPGRRARKGGNMTRRIGWLASGMTMVLTAICIGIFGQRYSSSGNPIGLDFQGNTPAA